MDRDIHIGGNWNILNKIYQGELVFNKDNGIIILIVYYESNSFMNFCEFPDTLNEITGITIQGGKCILTNCKVIKKHSKAFIRHEITIKVKSIFWGLNQTKKEKILFHKLDFKLDNILSWSKLMGIEHIKKPSYQTCVAYKFPKKIKIKINTETEIIFIPYFMESGFGTIKEVKLEQGVTVSIKKSKKTFYENFFGDLNFIIQIVMLATNYKNNIESIICYDNSKFQYVELSNTKRRKIYSRFEMTDYRTKKENDTTIFDTNEYLFSLKDLDNNNLLECIYQKYILNNEVIDLYLTSKLNLSESLKFQHLIQALEKFHSNKFKNKKPFMKHLETKLVNEQELLKNITDDKDQLDAYYIILRSRLIDLLYDHSLQFFTQAEWNKKCIELADLFVLTRHYYTHLNDSKKAQALKGERLEIANWFLSSILDIYLLKELGFDDIFINKKLNDRFTIYNNHKLLDKILYSN